MAEHSDGERRVDAGQLKALATAIFARRGMADDDAALVADSLVAADLRGVHSHGVLRIPEYVKRLAGSGINPRGKPRVVQETGGCLVVDGQNSMGQVTAHFAMAQVIARAEASGIAAAAIRGSNHCGAMAYFAMQALPHDMIGLATTNALPTMAPWGGAQRLLGINPLGVAIPADKEWPIVYDAAFSGSAHGKLRVYKQNGWAIPEGWALDRDGRPTTDAAAAIEGLLLPIGGFKGVGLALIMGIFSSLLSGAAFGTELGDMESGAHAGHDGHFVMALNIAAFENVEHFKSRVDGVIAQLHTCPTAPGFDRVYAPGEKEFLTEAQYRRTGIPLASETIEGVLQSAAALGVSPAISLT